MIILKFIGKTIYLSFVIMLYMMFFPLWLVGKVFFWWLPTGSDSYEESDEEWLFWKQHGHNW